MNVTDPLIGAVLQSIHRLLRRTPRHDHPRDPVAQGPSADAVVWSLTSAQKALTCWCSCHERGRNGFDGDVRSEGCSWRVSVTS